jgi:hypothetical protein
VAAHEFGHVQQTNLTGIAHTQYEFDDGNGNLTPDPPGAPPSCRCDQVVTSNKLHCLQSKETATAAQVEGWAHFMAAKFWNDQIESDCTFNY